MNASKELVIQVSEARKLLGKDADKLSDEQIIDLILALTAIAAVQLEAKKVPKSE